MFHNYLTRSGGHGEVAVGASVGALFCESGQLGSHVRVPVPPSKPISPGCSVKSPRPPALAAILARRRPGQLPAGVEGGVPLGQRLALVDVLAALGEGDLDLD